MYPPYWLWILILFLNKINSQEESLFIKGSRENRLKRNIGNSKNDEPDLKKLHVISNIENAYAITVVHAKYLNLKNVAQEASFLIILPEKAFISDFIMEINDKQYKAYVRKTEDAKREYEEAVKSGTSAAHVTTNIRDLKEFKVFVNVEAQSKVIFNLTYEQLLERKLGKYEMVVNLYPKQFVEDLSVIVNIKDERSIIDLRVPEIQTGNDIIQSENNNKFASILNLNNEGTHKQIKFTPTIDQQRELKIFQQTTNNEINPSQFFVEYDVKRESTGGDVIINSDFFVYSFAPDKIEILPKHIIFVLDVSGSMEGYKIAQLISAMKIILGEIHENDYFSIIKFDTNVHVLNKEYSWSWTHISNPTSSSLPNPIPANIDNIFKAQKIIDQLKDNKLTNIHDALLVALRIANAKQKLNKQESIIVFLTDGFANEGKTDSKFILDSVKKRNEENIEKSIIYTLAFGKDAKEDFLHDLAKENSGFMRKIYESSNLAIQFQNFYKEISSPLLKNITFKFEDQIKKLTKKKFDIIFQGSELVVAGQIQNLTDNIFSVEGISNNKLATFFPNIKKVQENTQNNERLWAYLNIKQMLENNTFDFSEQLALDLALNYSFVTPLTSLVVVKPNKNEIVHTEKLKYVEGKTNQYHIQTIPKPVLTTTESYSIFRFQHMGVMTSFDKVFRQSSPAEKKDPYPWLKSYYRNAESVKINNTIYFLGNKDNNFDFQKCQTKSNQSGQCMLLEKCTSLRYQIPTYEAYMNYFCTLNLGYRIKFLGICCV